MTTYDAIRELVYRETCPDGCGKRLPFSNDVRLVGSWHETEDEYLFPCTRNTALAEKVVEMVRYEREACAVIADTMPLTGVVNRKFLAAAIRARGGDQK